MREILNANGKMTSLVIAEITGKPHKNVMKAIRSMEDAWVNLGQSKFGLTSYIDSRNRAMPMYELTKMECLYIATKFNDEARAKLVLRWHELETERQKEMTPAEQLLRNAQLLVEQERRLSEHDNRLKDLEAKTSTRPDYFTIAGYGSMNGININIKIASKLGREAARLCKMRGYPMDETPDPRFGKVRMYPKAVLVEVFDNGLN